LEYLKKEIVDFFKDENSETGVRGNSPLSKGDVTAWQGDFVSEKIPPTPFIKGGQNTLYFWWWTPSILSIEELQEIFKCFPFFQQTNIPTNQPTNSEITLESNPEDITEEKVKWWKDIGINRVSLWVQSLDDIVLNTIKRANRETILYALEILNKHFENINVDFILGLPYSMSWDTLGAIRELHTKFPNITHTSVYILEDERYPMEWKNHYPSNEEIQTEYGEICDYLENKWWHHYEISNWAKPWYESTHNQSYWNHSDYRGFWLSAASFSLPPLEGGIQGGSFGKRFSNSSNFRDYFAWKQETEVLTEKQIRIEKIMFSLRTFSLDETIIQNKKKLEQFIDEWLLQKEDMILFPTKTWIFMLDHIIGELID
jgi:oxygen-independent coproporphyrinogen-3 oxidase